MKIQGNKGIFQMAQATLSENRVFIHLVIIIIIGDIPLFS